MQKVQNKTPYADSIYPRRCEMDGFQTAEEALKGVLYAVALASMFVITIFVAIIGSTTHTKTQDIPAKVIEMITKSPA